MKDKKVRIVVVPNGEDDDKVAAAVYVGNKLAQTELLALENVGELMKRYTKICPDVQMVVDSVGIVVPDPIPEPQPGPGPIGDGTIWRFLGPVVSAQLTAVRTGIFAGAQAVNGALNKEVMSRFIDVFLRLDGKAGG